MSYLLAQYGVELEIDITPFAASPTWKPVCDGFNNLTEAMNEQTQEYFFLCGKGFGTSEVTGIHPVIQLTGVRKVGDAAQDFIFGNRYNLMEGRKTNIRLSLANADGTVTRYTVRATMQNVSSFGGATTDGAAVSVDFSFNGRPVVDTVAASASLTVTSVAGTIAIGDTVITVVPTYPDAGCKFVYAWDTAAPTANIGDVLTGWNDFVNGATFSIPNGKKVTVAMVNVSTYKVVGNGNATVVSKVS
jgi:hypothetical protein